MFLSMSITISDATLNDTPELRVRLVPLNMFKPSSDFSLTVLSRSSFVDHFLLFTCLFHVNLCFATLFVPCSLVIICWERADLLAHLCVVVFCVFVTFPLAV